VSETVGTHEAKTHLSEYLNRVAYRGERIIVERHGKPVAALVSVRDLRRLEDLDRAAPESNDEAAREARFRQLVEEAGLSVHWPTGRPVERRERRLIHVEGEPISEQIIRERR
jgi:prevent-host-death family protein